MKVLVTGATGFVGRAVVAELLAQGCAVRVLVRSGSVEGAEVFTGDLASPALVEAMLGVDAVIHTAASLSGNEAEMMRDTVEGTRALMAAVKAQARPPRVVITSSMSVYGADCPPGSVISEDSPRETRPQLRDGYTRAKMAQEDVAMVQAATAELWLLRIGAVFGPGRLWNGHIGLSKGPVVLRLGGGGEIPLCYVAHAAAALVAAARTPADGVEIVNVVDEDRPDRMRYLRALKQGGWPKLVIPAPWQLFAGLGRVLSFWDGRPGLLRGPVLRARMMPLRYSNARLKARLGWTHLVGFEAAMEQSLAEERG